LGVQGRTWKLLLTAEEETAEKALVLELLALEQRFEKEVLRLVMGRLTGKSVVKRWAELLVLEK
jgi:hypothetical protein